MFVRPLALLHLVVSPCPQTEPGAHSNALSQLSATGGLWCPSLGGLSNGSQLLLVLQGQFTPPFCNPCISAPTSVSDASGSGLTGWPAEALRMRAVLSVCLWQPSQSVHQGHCRSRSPHRNLWPNLLSDPDDVLLWPSYTSEHGSRELIQKYQVYCGQGRRGEAKCWEIQPS